MAEITSREQTAHDGDGLQNDVGGGRVHVVTITAPDTQVIAQNDVIESPVVLPISTRIVGYRAQFGAHGASVVLSIGLRQTDTDKTVIDEDCIAVGIDVSSAGVADDGSGDAGVYLTDAITRTTVKSRIYASYLGANPTDDAKLRIDVFVAFPG